MKSTLYAPGTKAYEILGVIGAPNGLPVGLRVASWPALPDHPEATGLRFTGDLHSVVINLPGDVITGVVSKMRMAMARGYGAGP